MKRKSLPKTEASGPKIPVGSSVVIKKSNVIWIGCSGEVVKINDDKTHHVFVAHDNGKKLAGGFHANVLGSNLEWDL